MTNPFTELLAEKGALLADGATGTNLFNMGLMSGDAPELWNTDEPKKIIALYKGAVDAGSDLFLTNSFGANASRLKLHDAAKRAHELSRVAAEIGREVADTAGRKVIVAGSVGPTGEIMEPVGSLSHALAVEMFHETADGLKAGGADIGWLETISAPEEYRAAAEGFALAGLDWVGTMSFDTAGRTMMGLTSEGMVEMVHDLDNAPLAFGANCGTGASDLLRTILGMAAKEEGRLPIVAKGNAGIPKYVDGHIHYDGTPELMADYAVMARNCGASVIGGCCGTMPSHLEKMREALDTKPKGSAPELDEIVAALGPFSSAGDGTGDDQAPERRSRRGRRRG
ncbi:betaine--homocysteine S-methyltransferase [Sulfitobacter mediterraneus]|jgi:5-methyltetrahydrofolate--homocysteine methyltransferase|uniref:betaine--homocysteine S-methyltransferase n=1 Tax=Sulfitobacter mediterraneus TaxID=83219 RepID=UPI0021A8D834|nr:betaine--homocysteine S-methyltransferase [Sulfitobacter mediterraneus]UWR13009.1 betaine--homocysteine S-methyltransferase [Sulfitobacter mediterraneus]